MDEFGAAIIGPLITEKECAALAALYHQEQAFRSRVVMAAMASAAANTNNSVYPLPELVAALRTALYPRSRRSPTAGTRRWASTCAIPPITRRSSSAATRRARRGRRRCCCSTAPGDYNCLHQDLYGEHVFPLQVAILLSEPGRDFTGGEFVLTEQRPRMQSRAEVVPLRAGRRRDLRRAPAAGARARAAPTASICATASAACARGRRHTLGIIFHDAA